MTTPVLYRITVPVLILQLEGLRAVVYQGAESCTAGKHDQRKLIESRLAPDMLPLAFQVQTCCRVTTLLSQLTPLPEFTALPASSDDPKNMLGWIYESFADLDARIALTLEYLRSLDSSAFEGKENEPIQFMSMKYDSAVSFVQDFLFPNFFFHKTTAYNLLRTAGVEISKGHYLGKIGGL
nr:hypothetical protein CFP56_21823 [Quercus suber]